MEKRVSFVKIINYESVLIATVLARVISSLYNYSCNARLVFKKNSFKILIKYFELVVIQMLVSAFLVYIINKVFVNDSATIIKVIVDTAESSGRE